MVRKIVWGALMISILGPGWGMAREAHKQDEGRSKKETHETHKHKHDDGQAEKEVEVIETLKGEIIDMACYMGHGAKGKKHRKCAKACLLEGIPAGLLTKGGEVYLLLEDHSKKASKKAMEKLKQLAAEMVEVTGKIVRKGGVQALIVHTFKSAKN